MVGVAGLNHYSAFFHHHSIYFDHHSQWSKILKILHQMHFDCNNSSLLELEKPPLRSLWAESYISFSLSIYIYGVYGGS